MSGALAAASMPAKFALAVVGGTIDDVVLLPGNARATWQFTSGGVEQAIRLELGTTVDRGNWIEPTSKAPHGLMIKFTEVSGTLSSNSAPTYQSLATPQSCYVQRVTSGIKTCTVRADLSIDGSTVLATGTATLEAEGA